MKTKFFQKSMSVLLALTMLFGCFGVSALQASAGDYDTPIIPVNPSHTHSFVGTVTEEATCTQAGIMTFTCSCGKGTYTEPIEPLGHDMVVYDGVGETCTEAGNKPYCACRRCGNYYIDEQGENLIADKTEVVIPAKGHRFEVTQPYCLNGCGAENPDYNPLHEHSYTVVVTEPTCTEPGYTTRTCECGDTQTDTPTEPLGHAYKAVVTAPTATALGYTTHTCTRCTDRYIDTYTAPTGKLTLKCTARTAAAQALAWNNVKSATGYQVQISSKDGTKWEKTVTLKAGVTTGIFKSLAAGNTYKFRARFTSQSSLQAFSPVERNSTGGAEIIIPESSQRQAGASVRSGSRTKP